MKEQNVTEEQNVTKEQWF